MEDLKQEIRTEFHENNGQWATTRSLHEKCMFCGNIGAGYYIYGRKFICPACIGEEDETDLYLVFDDQEHGLGKPEYSDEYTKEHDQYCNKCDNEERLEGKFINKIKTPASEIGERLLELTRNIPGMQQTTSWSTTEINLERVKQTMFSKSYDKIHNALRVFREFTHETLRSPKITNKQSTEMLAILSDLNWVRQDLFEFEREEARYNESDDESDDENGKTQEHHVKREYHQHTQNASSEEERVQQIYRREIEKQKKRDNDTKPLDVKTPGYREGTNQRRYDEAWYDAIDNLLNHLDTVLKIKWVVDKGPRSLLDNLRHRESNLIKTDEQNAKETMQEIRRIMKTSFQSMTFDHLDPDISYFLQILNMQDEFTSERIAYLENEHRKLHELFDLFLDRNLDDNAKVTSSLLENLDKKYQSKIEELHRKIQTLSDTRIKSLETQIKESYKTFVDLRLQDSELHQNTYLIRSKEIEKLKHDLEVLQEQEAETYDICTEVKRNLEKLEKKKSKSFFGLDADASDLPALLEQL